MTIVTLKVEAVNEQHANDDVCQSYEIYVSEDVFYPCISNAAKDIFAKEIPISFPENYNISVFLDQFELTDADIESYTLSDSGCIL